MNKRQKRHHRRTLEVMIGALDSRPNRRPKNQPAKPSAAELRRAEQVRLQVCGW